MSEQAQESKLESKQDGRRILFTLLGFFAVVACVDAYFVYKAVSTHSGVVSDNAYEIGLNYNDVIEEARRRKEQTETQGNE